MGMVLSMTLKASIVEWSMVEVDFCSLGGRGKCYGATLATSN